MNQLTRHISRFTYPMQNLSSVGGEALSNIRAHDIAWSVPHAFRSDRYRQSDWDEKKNKLHKTFTNEVSNKIKKLGYIVECGTPSGSNYFITSIQSINGNYVYGDNNQFWNFNDVELVESTRRLCGQNTINHFPIAQESLSDDMCEQLAFHNNIYTIGNTLPSDIIEVLKEYNDLKKYKYYSFAGMSMVYNTAPDYEFTDFNVLDVC